MDIIVVDAAGSRSDQVEVPSNVAAGLIIPKLVELKNLPVYDPGGRPISYRFHHKATGRQVGDADTLTNAGVANGDTVRLIAEVTAGSRCLSPL